MAKIKSAVELAMEKTAGLTIDREIIKNKELFNKGQQLASSTINNGGKDCSDEFKKYSSEELNTVKEGFTETILSNIRLPRFLDKENNLPLLKRCFAVISDKEDVYELIFNQLEQLFNKFIEDIQNLTESLKQQYMPTLMQKQQQYIQQTGREIQLTHEQDPEFMELLDKNRNNVEQHYSAAIVQAREELKKIV
ncbi:MAG: hypothetical protein GY786_25250 [Proteobacteria bacterium]|nr:hypothetical protein [Pseudomonadota bacterium]